MYTPKNDSFHNMLMLIKNAGFSSSQAPVTTLMPNYDIVKMTLSIMHNVISFLVLGSFFLTHNPSFPTAASIKRKFGQIGNWLLGRYCLFATKVHIADTK